MGQLLDLAELTGQELSPDELAFFFEVSAIVYC